jgi:hypothetical protein
MSDLSELSWRTLENPSKMSADGRRGPGYWFPKVLPYEQSLEAQLSDAIAQNGVET